LGLTVYLETYPELGPAPSVSPELVYEEYRIRHLYGDRPPLEKYQSGFPTQFPHVKKLLAEQPIPTVRTPGIVAPPPTVDLSEHQHTLDAIFGSSGQPTDPTPRLTLQDGGSQLLAVAGGYKLVKRIGSGSFGEVWRAEAPGGVAAAVKMILRPLDHEEAQ